MRGGKPGAIANVHGCRPAIGAARSLGEAGYREVRVEPHSADGDDVKPMQPVSPGDSSEHVPARFQSTDAANEIGIQEWPQEVHRALLGYSQCLPQLAWRQASVFAQQV